MRLVSRSAPRDRHLKAAYAGFGSAMGIWIPFVAVVLRGRGYDPIEIGLLLGTNSLGTVLSAPLWSSLADRHIGSASALRLALLGGAASSVGLAVSGDNVVLTAALFLLFGATVGPTTGLIDSLALEYLGDANAIRYGSFRLFGSLGWAVTVVSLGAVLEYTGLGVLFPLCAVGLLAWAALTTRFPTVAPQRRREQESRFGSTVDALVHAPHLRTFLAGLLLVNIGSYAAWNFLPLRIAGLGGGPFLVGLGPGVGALIEVPLMLLTARVILRAGLRVCYALGTAVYALQMLIFAAASSPVILAIVYMARGAGFAFAYVAAVRIAGAIAPAHLQNAGQLLNTMITLGIAPMAGSVMGGFVFASLGASALFLMCAVLVVLGTAVVWRSVHGSGAEAGRYQPVVAVPHPEPSGMSTP